MAEASQASGIGVNGSGSGLLSISLQSMATGAQEHKPSTYSLSVSLKDFLSNTYFHHSISLYSEECFPLGIPYFLAVELGPKGSLSPAFM